MAVHLNLDLLYLEFLDSKDAKWVFEGGRQSFKGSMLQLDWWNPEASCVRRKEAVKEAWIRVVGLPLHMWIGEILQRIGDSCGGFIALDKDTTLKTKLLWACIFVRLGGRIGSNVIEAGSRSFELQVWWELLPWCAGLYPARGRNGSEY